MSLVRVGPFMFTCILYFHLCASYMLSNKNSFYQQQLLVNDQIIKQIRIYMFICMEVYACKCVCVRKHIKIKREKDQ